MPVLYSKSAGKLAEHETLWADDYIALLDAGCLPLVLAERGFRTHVKKEHVKVLLEFDDLNDYLQELRDKYHEGLSILASELHHCFKSVEDIAVQLRFLLWNGLYPKNVVDILIDCVGDSKPDITLKSTLMSKPTIQVNGVEDVIEEDKEEQVKARKAAHQNFLGKIRPPSFRFRWKVYYDKYVDGNDYSDRLILLNNVGHIGDFYEFYNNFPLDRVKLRDSVHLVHDQVKPVWEDPENVDGGSWTFRVHKDTATAFFHEVAVIVLSNQVDCNLEHGDYALSVSFSARFNNCLISVWNKLGGNKKSIEALKDTLLASLSDKLRPTDPTSYFYKKHSEHKGFEEAVKSTQLGKIVEEVEE